MTFGERLANARNVLGLTQDQLGAGLGTNGKDAGKSVVLGWEKGRHFPKADQLAVICERVRCTADYLIRGEENTFWPFQRVSAARVLALPASELPYIEGALETAVVLAERRAPTLRKSLPPQEVSSAENPTSEPISEAQDVTPAEVVRELRDRGVGDRGSNAQRGQTGRKAKRAPGGRA